MQVRFYNISWDTSGGEDDEPDAEFLGLPKGVVLEVEADVDLNSQGADILSDKYGYCVNFFDWEKI